MMQGRCAAAKGRYFDSALDSVGLFSELLSLYCPYGFARA